MGAGFLKGLYRRKVETTDHSSSILSKRTSRANHGFGWGKFFKFYLYIEYLSQLNSLGLLNCTYHRTLGALRRTAPIIIDNQITLTDHPELTPSVFPSLHSDCQTEPVNL